MAKNRARNFEWATVGYEKAAYDVCICMVLEEIRPVDSEINIIELMDRKSIEWMYEQAMQEIDARLNAPHFNDMSQIEYLIDEGIEDQPLKSKAA